MSYTHVSKTRTPMILWNNFTKTDQLSVTIGREDRYSFATHCGWKVW